MPFGERSGQETISLSGPRGRFASNLAAWGNAARRARRLCTCALLAIVAGFVLGVARPTEAIPEPLTLTVYTAVADGVVHWFPATLVMAPGTPLTLVVVNHLERTHWFILTGTGVNLPVPAGSVRTAQVTLERTGTYPFFDPHDPEVVGGVLIVVESGNSPWGWFYT